MTEADSETRYESKAHGEIPRNASDGSPVNSGDAGTSGARIAVAVVNFVVGGLYLVMGGFFLASYFFLSILDFPFTLGKTPDQETPFGGVAQFVLYSAIFQFVLVIPMVASGVGLLKRQQWGLIMGVVIGILAAALALLFGLYLQEIQTASLFGSYSLFTLFMLTWIHFRTTRVSMAVAGNGESAAGREKSGSANQRPDM